MKKYIYPAIMIMAAVVSACEKENGNKPELPKEGTITDARDGKTYKTIRIGDQIWLAQNLAFLPEDTQDFDISWTEPKFYVWGDYDLKSESEIEREMAKASLDAYGVFYNWWAAMNGDEASTSGHVQGICPDGWHLPTVSECDRLVSNIAAEGLLFPNEDGTFSETNVAKALALATENWMLDPYDESEPKITWPAINWEENNASGFSAYPAGFRACAGEYDWMQSAYSAGWWTSTKSTNMDGMVCATRMYSNYEGLYTGTDFNPGVGLRNTCKSMCLG